MNAIYPTVPFLFAPIKMDVFADLMRKSGSFSLFMSESTMHCLYLLSIFKNYKACYNRCFSSSLTEEQIDTIEEPKELLFHGKPSYCSEYWIHAFCTLVPYALSVSPLPETDSFSTFYRECIGEQEDGEEKSVLHLEDSQGIDALAKSMNDLEEEKKNERIRENYMKKAKMLGLPIPYGLELLLFFIAHMNSTQYRSFLDEVVGRVPILTNRQSTAIEEWRRERKGKEGTLDEDTMTWLFICFKL